MANTDFQPSFLLFQLVACHPPYKKVQVPGLRVDPLLIKLKFMLESLNVLCWFKLYIITIFVFMPPPPPPTSPQVLTSSYFKVINYNIINRLLRSVHWTCQVNEVQYNWLFEPLHGQIWSILGSNSVETSAHFNDLSKHQRRLLCWIRYTGWTKCGNRDQTAPRKW